MTLYADYVSIAGTTSGVTGTITIPDGSRIVGLNLSMKTADGGIISSIELTAPNLQQPLRFVPPMAFTSIATNMLGVATAPAPLFKLNLAVRGTNTVTIKVTTTANETVIVGLMWV